LESGRRSLYLHNGKDGNEERAPSPSIPSGELTRNGLHLNKRRNLTEELQLKQDQVKKKNKKQEIYQETQKLK